MALGGGPVAAREVDRRGPTLRKAEADRNAMMSGIIDRVAERGQEASAAEFATALDQERQARVREDAAQVSAAEREQELAQRQADFDQSVKSLSQMSIDPNRFWASRSTPQKIAGFAAIFLGGALQGLRGGSNPGLDIVNQQIDRDIKAQEFAYGAARDAVQAKQTAFGMAMQKYQNVDVARAAARAAALDAVQAQVAQIAAMWKGTDAANRASMAQAALEDEKMRQIAQGIAFMPATQAPRVFVDRATGLRYTEAEMKAREAKADDRDFEREKIALNTAGDVIKTGAKTQAELEGKRAENQVRLPTGEVVAAPSSAEATTLRTLSTAVQNANQLVSRAKQLRSDKTNLVPGTKGYNELKQIQSELTLAYKDRGGLGALSGPDMDLAMAGTGDLLSPMPNVDASLDSFAQRSNVALANRVKTLPNASAPRAEGKMPSSFTPHGGK